jgi:hypothetical protein
MMSEPLGTASKPDYNAIPVQLSAEAFEHLAASLFAQARTAMQAWVSQALQLYSQSALHWDAVEGAAD